MATEEFAISVGGVDAAVVRKDIKNLHLGVYPPDGRVRVAAPRAMTPAAIHAALTLRLPWIRHQIRAFADQPREEPREFVSGETHYHLGRPYRLRVVGHARASSVRFTGGDWMEVAVRAAPDPAKAARTLARWSRRELLTRATALVPRWAERLGVPPPAVGIKAMRTRWGACSPATNRIWLNLSLLRVPPRSLEYVIVHEIAHLRFPNHQSAFVTLLDDTLPGWRGSRRELTSTPYSTFLSIAAI